MSAADSGAPSSIASAKKYMLATECSKPAATKAVIGKTMASTLSLTLRPAIAIHTAMHTSTLHSTPRKNASSHGSSALAVAMRIAVRATAPSFIDACPDSHTSSARPTAPAKLAAHTSAQLRNSANVLTWPPAQAIAIRLLPVKSSAPATMTRMRPSENTNPPSRRDAAKPSAVSLATSVNINAPRPMKAPANTPSSACVSHGRRALTTPTLLMRAAMSCGE
jgi:hypothetical protein